MLSKDDPLELLMPRGDSLAVRKARDLTQFLRLFLMDAKSTHGPRVGLNPERACAEWEQGERTFIESALSDLARHYLAHACGADAIVHFGTPRLSAPQAFELLAEHGPELGLSPVFPYPGEHPVAFAGRALELLEQVRGDGPSMEIWKARLLRAKQGPLAALPVFEAGAKTHARCAPVELVPWICGWAECLLERGAVREARVMLSQHAVLLPRSRRLRCLAAWCLVLCGEREAAAELHTDLQPEEIHLPKALAELRKLVPEWLRFLPGRESTEESVVQLHDTQAQRQSLGASVLIEYHIGEAGDAEVARLELAAALRSRARSWLADHPAPHQEGGTLEQRCVLEDRVCVEHRIDSVLRGEALGGSQSRAIALVPRHDELGRVRGWVRLEFEHHLVPRAEYLLAWVRLGQHEATPRQSSLRVEKDAPLREAVFQDCMRGLGLESSQRRWWGFVLHGREPVLVGGTQDEDGPLGQGLQHGSALCRALDAAGHVRFDEAHAGWSVHPDSQSGVILQLRFAGRSVGLLVVESPRRRDFARWNWERHEDALHSHALALQLAAFRESQRRQHRSEAFFDAHAPGFRAFAERILRASERGQCVTLCGALGSGRKTIARWLHAQSPTPDAEIGLLGPDRELDQALLAELLERHGGSTLLFTEVERWTTASQRCFLDWLEQRELHPRADWPRPIVLMGLIPAQAESQGRMDSALARRLERMCWRVPALSERRGEVLKLFSALMETLARREQLRPPQLDDTALALLWRQRWSGNLVELESVALRCLLFAAGQPLDGETLQRLLREFGLRPLDRLPSRHPDRAELLAALSVTRLGTGRVNKTRAAMYLGWDPDTLVARMESLGIAQEGPFDLLSWTGLDFPVDTTAATMAPEP